MASLYKRGVEYFQVPTTLLAQVDSSIGGKTGIDTDWGKNQVGTIYQPTGVLIDPGVLRTMPRSEILNGVAEIIKYGIITDPKLFCELESSDLNDVRQLEKFIEPCCRIKAGIVSRDELERNERFILNYGHTVAHAMEGASNYSVPHGTAVLWGMLVEGWIAQQLRLFDSRDLEKQNSIILSRSKRK